MDTELVFIHLPCMRMIIGDLKWKFEGIYQIWEYISIQQAISNITSDLMLVKASWTMKQANHSGALENLITFVSITFNADKLFFEDI